jgi:ribosome-binding ATPase YchF (GTP1/OBG family)
VKIGIVGLPNVGKSTLFNAITKSRVLAANYPFATIEPNVGIVKIPDARVDFLANLYKSKSVIHACIEFVDIAGLVKGASKGEGLGNKFLAKIREVDAIVHVVRAFESENIVHVNGKIDPEYDIDIVNIELELGGILKPVIYCVNGGKTPKCLLGKTVVELDVKLEEELAGLDSDEERKELMSAYGMTESGLDKLARAAYKTLGLISYLTAGEPETRAWTIKNGTKAPQAAGKIHTDFEKGFIRAEVISFDEFEKCGNMVRAKEMGKVRVEGKDYIVRDGDIVHFRVGV